MVLCVRERENSETLTEKKMEEKLIHKAATRSGSSAAPRRRKVMGHVK